MDVFAGAEKEESGSFFTVDNAQVEIDAVKKSEDGKYLVVRFHDFAGSSQQVEVTPSFPFKAWAESDLRERPVEDFRNDGVVLKLHPYEIKTIVFEL